MYLNMFVGVSEIFISRYVYYFIKLSVYNNCICSLSKLQYLCVYCLPLLVALTELSINLGNECLFPISISTCLYISFIKVYLGT